MARGLIYNGVSSQDQPGKAFTSMTIHDQPAYILHRKPWRDTSMLLSLLTLHHGRVSVIVKGAQNSKRHNGAWLQPCQSLMVSWVGRSDLKTLTHYDTPAQSIRLTGERMYCGLYLNELLMTLLPEHDVQPELFALYAQTLDALQAEPFNSAALRQFELGLLRALGLAPDFVRAVDGKPIRSDARYGLNPEQGFFVLTGAPMPIRLEVSGQTLLALASDQTLDVTLERESKHLMRALIKHALNGKELKSRELFLQIRNLPNSSVLENK